MSNPPVPPVPPGSIDFQLTDLDDARRVLDLPPDGLLEAGVLEPAYWAARRRSSVPTDRALTGATMAWVVRLPADARPVQLCERFPRVANELARAWPVPADCETLLAGLLTDRRGKRRGFPADVQIELERLTVLCTTGI